VARYQFLATIGTEKGRIRIKNHKEISKNKSIVSDWNSINIENSSEQKTLLMTTKRSLPDSFGLKKKAKTNFEKELEELNKDRECIDY
jgi:hypothetical protein